MNLGKSKWSEIMKHNGLGSNSWGFFVLTVQFSTDPCFMFILSFYHFLPNCL